MEASVRPWFTTGVALVGAGAIALTPISPMAPARPTVDVAAVSSAVSRDVQLTAIDWPYILSLPIVRQAVLNEIEGVTVLLGGYAGAGVGLAQSLLQFPGVTAEVVQQVVAGDFVGAFNTITAGVRDSVIAVGQPLLESLIWRSQKNYLVQAALGAATPLAILSVVNGFLVAGGGVTTSLIEGTQNLAAAIVSLNLADIVNAAVAGTQGFVAALGAGAGAIVSGIEAAQFGIATALATSPPPLPAASAVADVSSLRTFSADNTVSVSQALGGPELAESAPVTSKVVTDGAPTVQKKASVVETTIEPEVTETPEPTTAVTPSTEPTSSLKPETTESTTAVKPSNEPTSSVKPSTLSSSASTSTSTSSTDKDSESTKATSSVSSPSASKSSASANDGGASAKSSSGGGDE